MERLVLESMVPVEEDQEEDGSRISPTVMGMMQTDLPKIVRSSEYL